MKAIQLTETPARTALPAYSSTGRAAPKSIGCLALMALLLGTVVAQTQAQTVQFRSSPVRVTVPLNSTNSTLITNFVNLSAEVTNAVFDVSGLPAGASAILTDTNLAPMNSTTQDTNFWLTVNTTNIAPGRHTFTLNASGSDTNGTPVTNHIRFVLQAAHIWNGSLNASNAWLDPASWLGGLPGVGSDVVFGDQGAQTNAFTNSFVTANTEIGSLRFSQTGLTNAAVTNAATRPQFHSLRLSPGVTLSLTGTNGLSLLRDHVEETYGLGTMTVNIGGGVGSRLVVSNDLANIGVLLGNQAQPTLSLSNLETFVAHVSRLGFSEYQLYPNYRNLNDDNDFGGNPRRFISHIFLARTNIIRALWADPENYTNELTRTYSLSYENSELSGVGSSVNNFFYLGQSNAFFLDSVCFIRANHATGNGGFVRFNPVFANGVAVFRGTNGGRMSVFTVSDDGGTNRAASNVKANIDFASGNGFVDILADRFYISRDRTLIASNQTPNVQGDMWLGRGIVDVNTAILGFQEHNGKTDWTTIGGAEPYLNYCQGRLVVTNGGTFRVNGTLTLGFTADSNPSGSAQQFNTYGQITVYSNSTVMASNIVVDGGLNLSTQDRISLLGGTLVVTNTVGDSPGIKLEALTLNAGTLALHVNPSRTNVLVKNLLTPGSSPSVIKVASLSGIGTFPAQVPVISYETAAPFLVADVSSLGAGFSAYVLDNADNKTVDVYITTNPPNALIWSGNVSANWDTTTANWVTSAGGVQTNFTLGDTVTFNDSSAVNSITVVGSVVPGQVGNGVTVSNVARNYTFSGGTIAGTGNLLKQGAGTLTVGLTKQGPVTISGGTVSSSGTLGITTVASGATLNSSGLVNGGLTSTGSVSLAVGGTVNGGVTIRGGTFVNSGTVATAPGTLTITGNAVITNAATGVMDVAGGNWALTFGSTLANFGTINNLNGRLNIEGTVFGTGSVVDPNSTLPNPDGRIAIRPGSLLSPGDAPANSIGTFHANGRLDHDAQNGVLGQLLIEVDFNHAQTNDMVAADLWNNLNGLIVMTNINPGAGAFGSGQSFRVFANNNGIGFPNVTDAGAAAQMPVIAPPIPGAGLHWNLRELRTNGIVGITNSLVWRGSVDANWDTTTANWLGGAAYADELGVLFDDTATGSSDVNLAAILAPASTNRLPTIAPGIIVNNSTKNYTFSGSGSITGATGLYKTGSGTLTILTTTNSYTGVTTVEGGTLAVSLLANVNLPSSIGTPGAAGTPGGNAIGAERLVLNGATLVYLGTNASANRPATIGANGAGINVASNSTELTLAGTLLGPGALTKAGPGTLRLSQGNNVYAGVTTISDGVLQLTASGTASTNTIVFAGGDLQFVGAGFTLNNAISIPAGGSKIILTNANVSGGAWTGNGTVTLSNTAQLSLNASITGFEGTISLGSSSGTLRFNNATNANNCTGSAAATFDLGSGSATLNNHNGGGLTYHLGALTGGPTTTLGGRGSNTTAWVAATTYSIGANGSNTVFSGTIANGADTVSITKVGAGTLLLNGNNTYTGQTTVSAGTLGGTGTITGPVTVEAGGTLSPGASIGTLTINNTLTLAGTTAVEVSKTGSALDSDRVAGLTGVTFGGNLVVSHLGPEALAAGDSFQLFNIGGSGNFASITPALTGGFSWEFNPATGVLSVTGPGNQPQLGFEKIGNNLVFSWTVTGFKLQAQTNSLNVGISNNWVDYPNGATSGVSVPIDQGNSTVFFRLISTP
jgi:autotransporter-associated beta strand protein